MLDAFFLLLFIIWKSMLNIWSLMLYILSLSLCDFLPANKYYLFSKCLGNSITGYMHEYSKNMYCALSHCAIILPIKEQHFKFHRIIRSVGKHSSLA